MRNRSGAAEARAGALWGLAFGDSLSGGGDLGPALAVWDAIASRPGDLDDPGEPVVVAILDHLLSWYADQPCGVPAPTLSALRRNGAPASWVRLAVPERSRATVVRAAWLGVHPEVPHDRLVGLAQAQALATDAHPVAPVAAQVAAALTAALASGQAVPGRATAWVRSYVGEARTHRPGVVLERIAGATEASAHLATGWATLVPRLCGPDDTDGGDAGDGAAESSDGADGALATALRLLDAADPYAPALAVGRAAGPHGSPSAAALLGAFFGAARGPSFGTDWVVRLSAEDREALTLRESGGAPRRYALDWRLPVRSGPEEHAPEPVGAPG